MASKTDVRPRRRRALKTPPAARGIARRDSGEPLYRQVVRALKDEIVQGIYPVGSQLPTEEELCARFSVSRYTVREALRRLRDDDLVSSRQGAGTTVTPPRDPNSYVHEVTSINDLVAFARGARFDIDTNEMVTAGATLAARLGAATGDRWLLVRGFRYTDESELPVCWTEVFINAEFAGVSRLLQRNRGPIFQLIEDLYGQRIAEVHQDISAAEVPAAMAKGLKVKAGAMALLVQRTYRVASGKIVQVAFNTHPAERFRHSMTMRRVKG
jgi:GntR family transcriptional regulator